MQKESVEFVAADGLKIAGSVFVPGSEVVGDFDGGSRPGAILLHQLSLDHSSFNTLAGVLAKAGITVLAYDLRGHGNSVSVEGREGALDFRTMTEPDFAKIPGLDLEAAKDFLVHKYGVNASKIGLVGASIGANAALISAGRDPRVAYVVALSPGLDYRGVQPERDVASIQKPILFVASSEDISSAQSVATFLDEVRVQDVQVVTLQDAGHGTHMFAADSSLLPRVSSWILDRVQ